MPRKDTETFGIDRDAVRPTPRGRRFPLAVLPTKQTAASA